MPLKRLIAVAAGALALAQAALVQAALAQPAPTQRIELPPGPHAKRAYLAALPADMAAKAPLPVVLLLHGAVSDPAQALASYGFADLARARGLAAIAPFGTRAFPLDPPDWRHDPLLWNDGSGAGHAARAKIDDLGFLEAVLDDAAGRWPLDPERVYVVGFGEGGSMALRMVAERPDRLAGAASVAGALWVRPRPQFPRPLPVMVAMNEADPFQPWNGGPARRPWLDGELRVPALVEILPPLAQAMLCRGGPARLGPGRGIVERRYGPCGDGAVVTGLTIAGAGHRWPGAAADLLPDILVGPKPVGIDMTRTIWDFLAPHRRKAAYPR